MITWPVAEIMLMLIQHHHPGPETSKGRLKRNLSTVLEMGRHEALPNKVTGKRGYLLSCVYSHLCLGGPVSMPEARCESVETSHRVGRS